MTRIIAGAARGRRLVVGEKVTRPTSDRAREALFASLGSELDFPGARVLDLYAGSGALGLEALSRGAEEVWLVESDARAVAAIRRNIETLSLPGAVLRRDRVERFAAKPAERTFDLIFADPPYQLGAAELAAALRALCEHGWVAPNATVVVERASRDTPWEWPEPLESVRFRRYGEATLWYGRAM